MSAALDVLHLRRPKIDYVSPPVCEVVFTGSGGPLIVLDPFDSIGKITGVVIDDDGNSRIVSWPNFPGAICYTIYEVGEDGELIVVAECVEGPNFPLPPGSNRPIVVTPITPDGEGDPSDPVTPPPDGGGGGGCDVFCDETNVAAPGITLFGTAKNIGLVGGTNTGLLRPWVYRNRADSDLRASRDSGTVQGSQSASDLVNTTADFFLPGDVGKFLQFDSGGNAREIILVVGPTQVQVDVSDTVALSEFTVYGTTLGGPQGNIVCVGNGNHVAGVEARADLSGQDTFWCDRNTGEIRVIGNFIDYGAQHLNTAGFLLYTFNDGATIQSFVYNPNTSTSSQVGTNVIGSTINDSNVVTGYELVDGGSFIAKRAIRWSGGVTTYIDPPDSLPLSPGPLESARDGQGYLINSSGMIVGFYSQNQGDNEHSKRRTFINNGGASFSIGHFFTGDPEDGTIGEMDPSDLSDSGIAVGTGEIAAETFRGWKWSFETGLVQLGVLPGFPHGAAVSVNDAGYIVGISHGLNPNATAVIWFPGETTPQPLINFVDPEDEEGWDEFIHVSAITNDNEVVGVGMKDGNAHFFFLKLCLD